MIAAWWRRFRSRMLRWQIGNLERFIDSPWCDDPEMKMLANRELRNRQEMLRRVD